MEFILIDQENWSRREHYNHYLQSVRCTYSLTTNLDITRLRAGLGERGRKSYPAFVYMITAAVNRHREFRMSRSAAGELGYWEALHPSYTVFNKEAETFSSIWSEFTPSFGAFYGACVADMERYGGATCLQPKPGGPPNTFDISCLPWVSFTGFNLNVYTEGTHLLPIFTIGRFTEEAGRVPLPISIQVHHAVCDGYHVAKFVETLQALADRCEDWLDG